MKAVASALIAVVLCNTIPSERKELTVLLSVAVCCLVGIAAFTYLQPVIAFLKRLQLIGNLNNQMVAILLKVVGIGIVTEIASLICKDVGNGALGKGVQLLSTAAILWSTIPLFEELLALIEEVLTQI